MSQWRSPNWTSALPGAVLLRNVSSQAWEVETPGESPQQVKPGHKVVARPRKIKIGGKSATIVRPPLHRRGA